jgi:hypothetical protein
MNYLIPDNWVYGVLVYFTFTVLFAFITWRLAGNYLMARYKVQFLPRREMVLDGNPDGSGRYKAMKEKAGTLYDKYEQIKIGVRSSIRTPDCNLYLANSRYGLTANLEQGAAMAALENLGFKTLPEALEKFDADWLARPEVQADLTRFIKEGEELKISDAPQIALKSVKAMGQQFLLKFQMVTPFTIPLAVLFNYGLAELDSQVNKNITDREVMEKEQEILRMAKQGYKMQDIAMIVMFIVIIIVAGALGMNMLPKQGATGPAVQAVATTMQALATTIQTTTTTVTTHIATTTTHIATTTIHTTRVTR